MSATADKARYFLEQSVPELRELERKKIFSPDEISSVARKRSDFEHKINARDSNPSDYAQYAEFEINVDALRRKRVKRMGIKSTTHNGQRRIHFVFDRGTRKFPGDIGLWMQSIEYAKRQKAYKKLTQMFATMLRLHPAKSNLWIYAAQFATDVNGDMTEARSYMQRGLRFCKNNRDMWLEYTRLEMAYIAKIHARRQILGFENNTTSDDATQETTDNDDLLKLPKLTVEDINPDLDKAEGTAAIALQNLDKTPVMSGAIPQTIFDAAMEHFQFDGALSLMFHDLFAGFTHVPPASRILDHVTDHLRSHAAQNWQTDACFISQASIGCSHDDPKYPAALRETIRRAHEALSRTPLKLELSAWYKNWLNEQEDPEMDLALKRIISAQVAAL